MSKKQTLSKQQPTPKNQTPLGPVKPRAARLSDQVIPKGLSSPDLKKSKKIQNSNTGTYFSTDMGRVGRTYGTYDPMESMDTSGYGSGKQNAFEVKRSYSGGASSKYKINRKDVPSKINEFKNMLKKVKLMDNEVKIRWIQIDFKFFKIELEKIIQKWIDKYKNFLRINSNNKIIYSLPYNPNLNPIENLFSQLKNHIKNRSPDNYEQLKSDLDYIIKNKVSKEHLENYFNYLSLYGKIIFKQYLIE